MSAPTNMKNTCSIYQSTNSRSNLGEDIKTYPGTASFAGVPCSCQESGGDELNLQTRMIGKRTYNIFFPPGQAISNSDRISNIAGVAGLTGTEILEVQSPPIDDSGRGAYVRVTAMEVNL